MPNPTYRDILLDLDNGVLTATLNRPERMNAVGQTLHEELEAFFVDVERMHDVRAIVLTGAGRGFCAGGDTSDSDMREGAGGWTDPDPMHRAYGRDTQFGLIPARGAIYRLARNMIEMTKPLIAAVNGPAAGLGATLALLCDVVFMADTARIGDRHTRMGLTAGDGGSIIWPMLCGLNRAKEILMAGDLVDAQEAYRIGLVNHVVPHAEVVRAAQAYARKLADLPELGVRTTKVATNKMLHVHFNMLIDSAVEFEARCFASGEVDRAAAAFRAGTNRG